MKEIDASFLKQFQCNILTLSFSKLYFFNISTFKLMICTCEQVSVKLRVSVPIEYACHILH